MKNKGLHQYRFEKNPIEKKFATAWENQDKAHDTVRYLLSDEINKLKEVTKRDREVAATVIQWLGSDCGQYFVRKILK